MSYLDFLAKGSEAHLVRRDGNVLTLSAVDESPPSLRNFQPIAFDVIERDGVGYTIVLAHRSSVDPGNLYDRIVIRCEDPS